MAIALQHVSGCAAYSQVAGNVSRPSRAMTTTSPNREQDYLAGVNGRSPVSLNTADDFLKVLFLDVPTAP